MNTANIKTVLNYLGITFLVGIVFLVFLVSLYSYKTSEGYVEKITQRAIQANDSSICEKIQPDVMGFNFRDYCRDEVAINNNNIQACYVHSKARGVYSAREAYWDWTCFSAYFQKTPTANSSICDTVSNEILRGFERSPRNECLDQYQFALKIREREMQK